MVLAASVALCGAVCSSPTAYVVLTLHSRLATPIEGVTDVVVTVTKGTTQMKTLTYRHAALKIDQVTNTTLSVSFTGHEVGSVNLAVDVHNAAGCRIGTGVTSALIKKGDTATAAVDLDALNDCTQADGGVPDGSDVRFPGCNPVSPSCPPADGGLPSTCVVNCAKMMGECAAGGSGAPGTVCTRNTDCMPGTQCFDYSGTGCGVKVCLRFCDTAAQCPQPAADGGVGPGSVCQGTVQCSGTVTAYHTCTFSCDPRAAAVTAATTGCPASLSCLVVGNMDQVDCACAEASRIKKAGDDCVRATDCQPGLICNMMAGTQKCRPVCRCNAQGLTCTAAQNDCPVGSTCTALTNNTLYGVCL